MTRLAMLAALILATPAVAQPTPSQTTVARLDATLSGQPIVAPDGPLRIVVTEAVIPVGGRLAKHKHPYLRVAHVRSGRLKVTNHVTGAVVEVKAGDWAVDPIDQWHEGEVVGDEPVRLLLIDQAPPGAVTTVSP
jgi:quercetin dioxygenase-like cupin family protein